MRTKQIIGILLVWAVVVSFGAFALMGHNNVPKKTEHIIQVDLLCHCWISAYVEHVNVTNPYNFTVYNVTITFSGSECYCGACNVISNITTHSSVCIDPYKYDDYFCTGDTTVSAYGYIIKIY